MWRYFDLALQEGDSEGSARTQLFADETTTGDSQSTLRGCRRISIASRVSGDDNQFEWVRRLYADFADSLLAKEIKSADVILLCKTNPIVRDRVVRGVREADIFIIDLFQDYYERIEILKQCAPDPARPIQSIAHSLRMAPHELRQFLGSQRCKAVFRSIAPLVDDLRKDAFGSSDQLRPLIDLEQISKLSDQEFREFVVRFTVLFGDIVDPETFARVMAKNIATRCALQKSHFAVEILEISTTHDMTFDAGFARPLERLQEADRHLQEELQRIRTDTLLWPSRHVCQNDSAEVFGIQACDIAAGYARWRFDAIFDGNAEATAKRMRDEFARIMYNTRWLA